MKKLMAIAAVALVGTTFANTPCTIGTTPTTTNAAVYAWKFTGKTVVGAIVSKTTTSSGSVCQLGSSSTTTCAIRVPGSLAIQGYSFICDNCCDAFKDTIHGTGASDAFYMTKPFKALFAEKKITVDIGHIIGTKGTQYEAGGKATFKVQEAGLSELYTLNFAGLGTYNQKWPSPASISGNFAGTVEGPYYVKGGVCAPAAYWSCAGVPTGADEAGVAYGTWSVKLNTSAAKKYRANGTTIALPAWAR